MKHIRSYLDKNNVSLFYPDGEEKIALFKKIK